MRKKIESALLFIFPLMLLGALFLNTHDIQANSEKESLQEMRKQRNNLINSEKFNEAIGVDNRIIQVYPNSNEAKGAKIDIANNYYRLGDYDKAVYAYKKLVDRPSYENIRCFILRRIALCYWNQKEYEQSIKEMKTLLIKYPQYKKDIQTKIALGYFYSQKYQEMVETYLDLVKTYPEDPQVAETTTKMMYLSSSQLENIPQKTIEVYRCIAEHHTKFKAESYYQIGSIYGNIGDLDKAMQAFKDAADNSKDDIFIAKTQTQMADIYEKFVKPDLARKTREDALARLSDTKPSVRGLQQVAEIHRKTGNSTEEIKALNTLVKEFQQTKAASDAQYRIAAIYQSQLKDPQRAIEEYGKMIKTYPNDWRVSICWRMIGGIYIELKDYNKAIEVQKRIMAINPNDPSPKVLIRLIEEYYKKGKTPSPAEVQGIAKGVS
ncbi:MAG: tetratricopeptide repeat protein [Candidatus Ratteibacteria bacterium]|jgi:tetratricopeptide (TPR) repeat protein